LTTSPPVDQAASSAAAASMITAGDRGCKLAPDIVGDTRTDVLRRS
jgi:hypothetical protein